MIKKKLKRKPNWSKKMKWMSLMKQRSSNSMNLVQLKRYLEKLKRENELPVNEKQIGQRVGNLKKMILSMIKTQLVENKIDKGQNIKRVGIKIENIKTIMRKEVEEDTTTRTTTRVASMMMVITITIVRTTTNSMMIISTLIDTKESKSLDHMMNKLGTLKTTMKKLPSRIIAIILI